MNKCKYCGKEYKTVRSLKQHQKQYCSEYKKDQSKIYNNYLYKCICDKKFETKNALHGHQAKCNIYKEIVNKERKFVLTYDFLYNNLIINDYSAYYIATNILNNKYIDAKVIIQYAKNFNIKTKTIKEAANSKNTREKYKETCLKKYGSTNTLSKGTKGYIKRNNTVKEKYGVNNVFQLNEIKEKSKNTMLKNYGVTNSIYIKDRHKNSGRKSKIHKKIELLLENNSIDYISEKICNFKTYNNYLEREYNPRPDIIIENKKIIIEINGDYWHANPKKYRKNDIIAKWGGDVIVEEIWKFDNSRVKQMEYFGYKVIILWEYDINNNYNEVEALICKELV